MKKPILLLALCSIILHADYKDVIRAYQAGHYAQAVKKAKHSYAEYANPKLHLLWAKAAQKLHQTNIAMSAYERVLILDPNNQEAKHGLQSIYTQTNRMALSSRLNQSNSRQSLHTEATLALGHDSNINANPGGNALDNFYGVIGSQGTTSTHFLRLHANVDYTYHFEERERWFSRASLDMYNQSNFSAHYYDLLRTQIEVGIGYNSDTYRLYLPLRYNNIHYLNKNLLNYYTFNPRLTYVLKENRFLDLTLLYTKRAYQDNNDSIGDARSLGFGVGVYFPLYSNTAHLEARYEKRQPSQDNPSRFTDAYFVHFNASIEHYFTDTMYAEFAYIYRYGKYSDDIGTTLLPDPTTRIDRFNQIAITLSYSFNKQYEIYIKDSYARNNSNFTPTKYSKNIIMFGVNFSY